MVRGSSVLEAGPLSPDAHRLSLRFPVRVVLGTGTGMRRCVMVSTGKGQWPGRSHSCPGCTWSSSHVKTITPFFNAQSGPKTTGTVREPKTT